VDDAGAGQTAGAGEGGAVVGGQAVLFDPGMALLLDLLAAFAHNGPRDTSTVGEVLVGRVDNGPHMLFGQVAVHDFEGRITGKGQTGMNHVHDGPPDPARPALQDTLIVLEDGAGEKKTGLPEQGFLKVQQ